MVLKAFLCLLLFYHHPLTIEGVDDTYLLPKNVKPLRYFLTIEPLVEPFQEEDRPFKGSVTIELQTLAPTTNITLHTKALNINESSIKVSDTQGVEVPFLDTSTDLVRQFYIINLKNELVQDEFYNLSIAEFDGQLYYDNAGLYLAKYSDSGNEERILACTHFEPSDARKAFPSFDQPDLKAKFIVSLIRPSRFTSLANEVLDYTEDLGDGRFKDTFKETVIMSTYLVAFTVSDFVSTPRKERHMIYARPEAINEGKAEYALEAAVEILQILEKYTGINYTNEKMDLFAIPDEYFSFSAMENWGLVIFKERMLLVLKATSSPAELQRCIMSIAHEFVHQWFGNLVTFKEWQYVWLAEGFAAYFQYYIASLYKPDWRLMDQFIIETIHRVFGGSEEIETLPLNVQPDEVGSFSFIGVVYLKGSAVIRMTEHFLTEPVFQRALRIYLQENQFHAVVPMDLYTAYQKAVDESRKGGHLLGNISVATILHSWDTNIGFPYLNVRRNYENGDVTLTQVSNFNWDNRNESDNGAIWYIPINFAWNQNRNFSTTTADFWLTEKTAVYTSIPAEGWLLVNKQQTGVYRVNYDLTNWRRLAEFLNTKEYNSIHVANRAQILFDSFEFAKSGIIPFEIPLNLSKYLERETDYIPLFTFTHAIDNINEVIIDSKYYSIFRNYVINLLSAAFNNIGFDEKPNETHVDRLNRVILIEWLCKLGHSECTRKSLQKVREWKSTGMLSVRAELKLHVLCGAMRNAGEEDWEFLYNEFKKVPVQDNYDYTQALACSGDKNILTKFLDRVAQNASGIDDEDQKVVYCIAESGPVGLTVVLNYLETHPVLPENMRDALLFSIPDRLTTIEQIERFKELAKLLRAEGEDNYHTYHISDFPRANKNIDWVMQGYIKQIEDWLVENVENNNEI